LIINVGNIRIHLSASVQRTTQVEGINSNLPDGRHILLWDFDDNDINNVIDTMRDIQTRESLSNVYIVESSAKHYHALCFTPVSLTDAIIILSTTPDIDKNFVRIGLMRGFWTLRISPRRANMPKPKLVYTLWTHRPEHRELVRFLQTILYTSGVK